MANLKAVLADTFGRLVFDEPVVARVSELAPGFRRLDLQDDDLRGSSCKAGDKLQIFISPVGMRTYSPFAHDRARGSFSLLVYTHGDTPAAVWGQRASVGERVRVFGPRASLDLERLVGPVVVFGDETSIAVTRSLAEKRDGVHGVFEVGDEPAARQVCDALELEATLTARNQGEAGVRAALETAGPRAHLVLTGRAQSIQALRAGLAARPAGFARQHVKAHWSVGKRGLD